MAGPDYWQMFFEECKGKELNNIQDFYPEVRELEVRAGDLFNYMGKDTFLLALKEEPLHAYQDVWFGLNQCFSNYDNDIFPKITGRISDIMSFEDAMTKKHVKYFTADAQVLIKKAGIPETFTKDYKCNTCQTTHFGYQVKPKKCVDCGRPYNKKWEEEDGAMEHYTLLEMGDTGKDGNLITGKGYIYGLDTQDIGMGQKIRVNCIKNLIKEGKKWESKFIIIGWENAEYTWDDVRLDEGQIREFEQYDHPTHFKKMIDSIAPSVVGYEDIKTALLLQAVMGGFWYGVDKTTTRKWINILLAGDPGTAKSKLMEYIARLWPKALWGGGSRSSKAGLTVALVDDPITKGKKVPQAGVLIRANKGLALIDEMDKMEDKDQKSVQSAMENGVVNVAMANVSATFRAMTSIMASCNPKGAFYQDSPHASLREQIGISQEIFSRFDLKYAIRDIPETKKDLEINRRVWGEQGNAEDFLTPMQMRYYIAWLRRQPEPIVPQEIIDKAGEWISEKRNQQHALGEEKELDHRVSGAFRRLVTALATFNRHKGIDGKVIATEQDLIDAREIYHRMLSSLAGETTWDGTRSYLPTSKKSLNVVERIKQHIETYNPTTEEIHEIMPELSLDTLEGHLEKMNEKGMIQYDTGRKWRLV